MHCRSTLNKRQLDPAMITDRSSQIGESVLSFFAISALLVGSLSCARVPGLNDCIDFAGHWTTNWETTIPVILVGRIVSNDASRQQHGSCRDRYFTIQLYRVTVEVENILRGESIPSGVDIYYFSSVGSTAGPPRLGMRENGGRWHIGGRELFLLRRDSGVLRTLCDTTAGCVYHVFTGAHNGFRVDPTKPIAYSVVRLLLSRGNRCNDKQMIEAIKSYSTPDYDLKYTVPRLQEIAETETPDVRSAACKELVYQANVMHRSVSGLERSCANHKR
jgi:hypothetical protein